MAVKSYPFVYHDEQGPRVAILLGLCDGGRYLGSQLDSIAAQTLKSWSLTVSDDGSRDDGPAQVQAFAAAHPANRVRLTSGPQSGFAKNFLSLIRSAPESADFAAFCDQDDVWLPGKLMRAIGTLQHLRSGHPGLYCGRTIYTDARLRRRGTSPLFARPPSFSNALVQSIAGGNTMVFNRSGLALLRAAAAFPGAVPSHDWWAYQIISGAGGRIIYDAQPQVLYRQHGGNLVGGNTGLQARSRRIVQLLKGEMAGWSAQNIAALRFAESLITPQNISRLNDFSRMRNSPALLRLAGLARSGLYRQTRPGTGALWLASAIGRL